MQQIARALKKARAGLGELNLLARFAVQQTDVERLFEFLDLVCQRRRRYRQPRRRAREILLIAERHKILIKPKFDVSHCSRLRPLIAAGRFPSFDAI